MARVLAIDDDEQMRGMLWDMLRGACFEVVLAENGEDGLTTFNESPTDLVITDIMVPEVDGLEMIKQMVAQHPDVKIIAISGGDVTGQLEYLSYAEEWGAHRSFSKPFYPHELVEAVKFLSTEAAPTAEDKDLFLQRARLAAGLSHPNVVVIHEIGEYQGRPFLLWNCCRGTLCGR